MLPGDRHHCHSISSHSVTNQPCSLERQRHAATSDSPMTATRGYLRFSYERKLLKCRVAAPVTKRNRANCALSNHERHHGCQNAPTIYIQHKIPMYKNEKMLLNVTSSLSQHPSRSATKQTAPSRTTSDTTAARTLPHNIYIPQHMRSVSCHESTTIGVHIKTTNMCNACNFREDVDASTTFPGHR